MPSLHTTELVQPVEALGNGIPSIPNGKPQPRPAELTCSNLEAVVYRKLGWPPHAGSPDERAETAAVVGFPGGLGSVITREE